MPTSSRETLFNLSMNKEIGVGTFLESIIQLIYTSVILPGDAALDGGANRGMHTFPLARIVGERGLIIGFEAIPKLAAELKNKFESENIKNVQIKSIAIGNKEGFTEFSYVENNDYLSGIMENNMPDNFKQSVSKISVPCSTLDTQVSNNSEIRFIKLDLEGGEYHALMGAKRIMLEDKPLIVFENGREPSAKLYGYNRDEWFSLFVDRGYKVYDIFGRPFNIEDWNLYEELSMPWYFCAASRANDIEFVEVRLPQLVQFLEEVFIKALNSRTRA
jgi:FkbM family methyltransferase